MKTFAVTLTLVASLSSCTTEPETTTTADNLGVLGPDATLTEKWIPGKGVISDLWPTSATSMQILYRKAPQYCVSSDDICDARHGTKVNGYFAFVVWNHNTVGHVYFLPENSTGNDFKNFVNQTVATRTNGAPDHTAGSTGGAGAGDGGVRVPPRPNVYPVTTQTVAAAKTAAAAIDAADAAFIATSMQ